MKPSRRRRNARIIESTLALLVERYPACFVLLETKRKPLALGIRDAVIAARPELRPNHIGTALRSYVAAPGYLQKLTEGAARIGLHGQPAGLVSADEAAHALEQIAAARVRVSGERAPPDKPAEPPPEAPPAPVPAQPKRASLGDLRRAAQQRKTVMGG